MDPVKVLCQLCNWVNSDYPDRDLAGCRGTWHIYEEHPEFWRLLFGDNPPGDPDPRR